MVHTKRKTLVIGVRAFERLRDKPAADRVIVIDKRLPPTFCQRISHGEYLVGGLQFALELAGENAVVHETGE